MKRQFVSEPAGAKRRGRDSEAQGASSSEPTLELQAQASNMHEASSPPFPSEHASLLQELLLRLATLDADGDSELIPRIYIAELCNVLQTVGVLGRRFERSGGTSVGSSSATASSGYQTVSLHTLTRHCLPCNFPLTCRAAQARSVSPSISEVLLVTLVAAISCLKGGSPWEPGQGHSLSQQPLVIPIWGNVRGWDQTSSAPTPRLPSAVADSSIASARYGVQAAAAARSMYISFIHTLASLSAADYKQYCAQMRDIVSSEGRSEVSRASASDVMNVVNPPTPGLPSPVGVGALFAALARTTAASSTLVSGPVPSALGDLLSAPETCSATPSGDAPRCADSSGTRRALLSLAPASLVRAVAVRQRIGDATESAGAKSVVDRHYAVKDAMLAVDVIRRFMTASAMSGGRSTRKLSTGGVVPFQRLVKELGDKLPSRPSAQRSCAILQCLMKVCPDWIRPVNARTIGVPSAATKDADENAGSVSYGASSERTPLAPVASDVAVNSRNLAPIKRSSSAISASGSKLAMLSVGSTLMITPGVDRAVLLERLKIELAACEREANTIAETIEACLTSAS